MYIILKSKEGKILRCELFYTIVVSFQLLKLLIRFLF